MTRFGPKIREWISGGKGDTTTPPAHVVQGAGAISAAQSSIELLFLLRPLCFTTLAVCGVCLWGARSYCVETRRQKARAPAAASVSSRRV